MGTFGARMVASGIAVGKGKGHVVATRTLAEKPSHRKGRISKHTRFVRTLVRSILGFTPYERRCLELLKVGKEKRVLRVLRKKLGSLTRAKAKREELSETLRQMRLKQ
eukprot:c25235_g1_i1.p1 GENE.c25235_g1_i1~~c25235_g1_i1.p1  ORF type:complete len:108 (+),score=11.52 c25235_g1_i1:1-324(+)